MLKCDFRLSWYAEQISTLIDVEGSCLQLKFIFRYSSPSWSDKRPRDEGTPPPRGSAPVERNPRYFKPENWKGSDSLRGRAVSKGQNGSFNKNNVGHQKKHGIQSQNANMEPLSQGSEWTCTNCKGTKNFARNTRCFRCKASRPSGGPGDKGETTRDFAAEMREQIAQMQREVEEKAETIKFVIDDVLENVFDKVGHIVYHIHYISYAKAKRRYLQLF